MGADRAGGSRGGSEETPHLTVDHDPDHLLLRIARPPVNAFTTDMFGQLAAILDAHVDDPRPVLVVGASGIFSAGFDTTAESSAAADEAALACLRAVERHPAPVVSAVERAAVGFGLLLALSADVVVMSAEARIGMPEVRHGLASEPHLLRRHLPPGWVRRLCVGGELHRVSEMGLGAAGVAGCAAGEAEAVGRDVARSLRECDPGAVRLIKQRLRGLDQAGAVGV